ncbi:hypothetical protein [Methanosarcina sp. UBA289]|uniref:hypothetical protein n=1 Tax=Methanosarcina sp. UBA289 TaxID=1915574 RepID=UPI0025FBB850|nr:hypothetical protein [Methanosarcina sp. UBA289]
MDAPVSFIGFNESKIKRVVIDRPLANDELKYHRIRVGVDILRDYDPALHEFEIIRKNKES